MPPEMSEESSSLSSVNLGVFRTSATVKGGRRFQFGALVVVGDRRGQVGFGYAKSPEVPTAIEKAERYAKRTLKKIQRIGTTINHEVEGNYSASKVRLIPAAPGTGVVAGGVVRNILEIAGVGDCLTKCYGSTNSRNVVKAVFNALDQLRVPAAVGELRGQELGSTEIENKIEKGKAFMPTSVGGERKAKGPVNTLGSERRGGRGGPRGGGGRGGPRRGGQDSGGGPGPSSGGPGVTGGTMPAPGSGGDAPAGFGGTAPA